MSSLRLLPLRFQLKAQEPVFFTAGKAANILRGGFGRSFRAIACVPECGGAAACPQRGACPYAQIFEPRLESGPSGLADAPRPFVFRAPHLNGARFGAGEGFYFDLHLFDLSPHSVAYFVAAFQEFAATGIGPARGAAELEKVSVLNVSRKPVSVIFKEGVLRSNVPFRPVELPLTPGGRTAGAVTIQFLTPTELRKDQPEREPPPFVDVLARLRDRISNLRTLYGAGKPDFDFAGLSERARAIAIEKASLENRPASRLSGQSKREHPIGGFTGSVEYRGDLTEFLPLLKAGEWTGVGRHTVWGNGQLSVQLPD